jgi:uncharacterized protein (DUF1810 family)
MTEFTTTEDLIAHYKAVSERLRGPRTRPVQLTVLQPELTTESPSPPLPPISYKVVSEIPPFVSEPIIMEGRINFPDVIDVVVAHTQMRPSEIFARRRTRHIVQTRQMLWALAYKHCHHLSLPKIARMSKSSPTDVGYDHTTVLHAFQKGNSFPDFQLLSDKLDELRKKRTPS